MKKMLGLSAVICMLLCTLTAARAANIGIGDYVQIGTYYNKPILWRCVDKDENGALMLSDKIICIKPFDARTGANSETGSHSRGDRNSSWGSNYWADSNMRSWLNSNESAGNVTWLCKNPPDKDHVYYNAYDKEAGFLTNFTRNELGAVKETEQKSLLPCPETDAGMAETGTEKHSFNPAIADVVTNYDTAYAEYVTDKMFLLDVKQVNAVYNNGNILGEDYYIGEVTSQCVANSEYKYNGVLEAGKKWNYLLRSPNVDYDYCIRSVDTIDTVYSSSASFGDIGVRPAFYLSDSAEFTPDSEGTETNPYLIDENPDTYFKITTADGNTTVTNISGEAQNAAVIVAEYADGTLTDVGVDTRSFDFGETQTYTHGANARVFVWDSLSGMRPLAK